MTETKLMALREAINLAMTEEMRKDDTIYLMGEDVGVYGGDFGTSVGMIEEFGAKRVKDTPISEAAIAGAAIGSAITGLRPIVDLTFMDFITIALDAIVNNGAKNNYMFGGGLITPATFRVASGSGIGSAAQHSQSLEAWLTHIPGIKVVAPGTANEAKGLLKSAIRDNNIVIFMEPKALYGKKEEVNQDPDFYIPLGKGDIKREGTDVTIVSYGRMLERVLQAAEELAADGINVEVVDPRTLIPLDKELIINSVKKTGKLMLVNDAYKTGGFIGEIAAMVTESEAFDYLDHPIVRLASEDVPVPYARVLEQAILPDVAKIKAAIVKMVNKGN
ncbi:alpha-ketoacid dehydrogenase subunit beta [Streptococcus equi]|uniref:Pyruvate dehydrogenase E1 component beta subunit PdhB n=3 Tax=Streptococcus equi TaxID=1336 RepID=B4U3J4_STREM|nr:alpha-ketoacid dehydrogenase subunit beta [Streptococcus equi]ACG62561.1 pyruvate dehydrogenase E1 component beta subunit PdhB [Streptococcus equi subsp. zooepidemicus MGCS10565]ASB97028.1 alpha-ketoacid dehydrogenase subunit beta [Streptococcus equi subsp. equi]KIS06982.1 pyruvate dehydrogenase E1 component beta subunit [Streptococcus equi subsp. zooepidemicus Sz16]KIS07291.1 pyruvate dehydrogenase E1 component beta subunit [Streptococcus equi subsp. zooepidemicus Sz5]KIS14111.1 pyruvate d